jgi:fucose permease
VAAIVPATKRGELLRQTLLQAFSLACFLYVALECSIYVWLPTYLQSDPSLDPSLVLWAVPVFFALRAGGRFLGAFLLTFVPWSGLLLLFSSCILVCFLAAIVGGAAVALWTLPASGLFMSVIYPTLNSKGISCFAKRDHGSVAGILLFFTCLGAALGPLAMGAASDLFGDTRFCFVLAGLFAALLTAGLFYNWLARPTRARLRQMEELDYDGASARS